MSKMAALVLSTLLAFVAVACNSADTESSEAVTNEDTTLSESRGYILEENELYYTARTPLGDSLENQGYTYAHAVLKDGQSDYADCLDVSQDVARDLLGETEIVEVRCEEGIDEGFVYFTDSSSEQVYLDITQGYGFEPMVLLNS
jgi:hypothetical protein